MKIEDEIKDFESSLLSDVIVARYLLSRNEKLVKDYPTLEGTINYLDQLIERMEEDKANGR